jgi:hypothetical protein
MGLSAGMSKVQKLPTRVSRLLGENLKKAVFPTQTMAEPRAPY